MIGLLLIAALCFAQPRLIGMEKEFNPDSFLSTRGVSSLDSIIDNLVTRRLNENIQENTPVLREGFTQKDFLDKNKRAKRVIILVRESRPPMDSERNLINSYFFYTPEIITAVTSPCNKMK